MRFDECETCLSREKVIRKVSGNNCGLCTSDALLWTPNPIKMVEKINKDINDLIIKRDKYLQEVNIIDKYGFLISK